MLALPDPEILIDGVAEGPEAVLVLPGLAAELKWWDTDSASEVALPEEPWWPAKVLLRWVPTVLVVSFPTCWLTVPSSFELLLAVSVGFLPMLLTEWECMLEPVGVFELLLLDKEDLKLAVAPPVFGVPGCAWCTVVVMMTAPGQDSARSLT